MMAGGFDMFGVIGRVVVYGFALFGLVKYLKRESDANE